MSYHFNMHEIMHPKHELTNEEINELRLKYNRNTTAKEQHAAVNEYDDFVIGDPDKSFNVSTISITNQFKSESVTIQDHERTFTVNKKQTSFKVDANEGELVA